MTDHTTKPRPAEYRDVTSPVFLRAVLDAIDVNDDAGVKALVEPLHAADIAWLLGAMDASNRRALVKALGPDIDPEILSELDEDLRTELVRTLGPKSVADAVKELHVEDAAYVLEDLEDSEKREVLAQVPLADRAQVVDALLFPEETAGRVMHREFVTMQASMTVAEALVRLLSADIPEEFQEIYLVDSERRPVGFLALSRLLRATPASLLHDLA